MTLPQNITNALPNQSGGGGGAIGPVTPGTGPTDLGKAEDSPAADGDVGVFALAIRNDAPAGLAGANMDYSGVSVDSSGRVWICGSLIDGGSFVPASQKIVAAGAQRMDVVTPTLDGKAGALRMGENRELFVGIRDARGNDFGASVTASGQVVTLGDVQSLENVFPGVAALNLGKAAAVSTFGNGDVGVAALGVVNDGNNSVGVANQYIPVAVSDQGYPIVAGFEAQTLNAPQPIAVIDRGDGTGAQVVTLAGASAQVEIVSSVPLTTYLPNASSNQNFMAVGAAGGVTTPAAWKYATLQVVAVGGVTSWTVTLEGSLDAAFWTVLITHTNLVPGNTKMINTIAAAAGQFPIAFAAFRLNCTAIVLGAGTGVNAFGLVTA